MVLLTETRVNALYYGDNLTVLRDRIERESVDLIYLDPPFNSQASYNLLFRSTSGERSLAQIEAFLDTWHWNEVAEQAFDEVMQSGNSDVAEILRALRSFLKENDMMAYLTMMAVRLLELRRVLKPNGSLYLHCDPTASHYLKVVLDGVFGKEQYRNEIVWKRTSSHNDSRKYGNIHDVIFFYTKGTDHTWNVQYTKYDHSYIGAEFRKDESGELVKYENLTGAGATKGSSGQPWRGVDPSQSNRHWAIPRRILKQFGIDGENLSTQEKLEELLKVGRIKTDAHDKPLMRGLKTYLNELPGMPLQSLWADIDKVGNTAKERLGYPTQKPLALLQRIIAASSNVGDIVLDPFCGCGTAVHAAQKLNRQWIGIDITHLAISLIEKRLRDAFPGIAFDVHGTPTDLDGARALADRDKYQFQWWAVSLVDAVPYGGKKKGADSGIDGFIYFKPEGKATEKAIVSVKGGDNVNVAMVRDLAHVVDREKARIGVFITLAEPTRPMKTEAVKAGYYETIYGKYPKLQILTIAELLGGKQPKIPLVDSASFKRAAKEVEGGEQDKLPF